MQTIEQGFMQEEIAKSAYLYQQQIENGQKTIVGVNKFTTDEKNRIPVFKIDEGIQKEQTDKLKRLRETRNNEACNAALEKIKQHAINGQNLMPVVIEAVECYCTLGEISDELRKIFGEYK